MSRTAREGLFILLKVTKWHEEKRPEGHTELTKLKTIHLKLTGGLTNIPLLFESASQSKRYANGKEYTCENKYKS